MSPAQQPDPKVSQHFPFAIREKLVRAAQTPVYPTDLMARVRAVDEATAWARRHCPELFR